MRRHSRYPAARIGGARLSAVASVGSATGLAATTLWLAATFLPGTAWGWLVLATAGGGAGIVLRRCGTSRLARTTSLLAAPLIGTVAVGWLLLVPPDPQAVLAWWAGSATAPALEAAYGRRPRRTGRTSRGRLALTGAVASTTALAVTGTLTGAGAWSVDEPAETDPSMVRGNGVVVAVDTHAFLIQQGARILRNDGHTEVADFLDSPDPQAPHTRTADGAAGPDREPYLWRLQLGARDADRVLKKRVMPDHFFNWWTHSGKGLVAGTSAATWAEQQFAQAVRLWRAGDRSRAMYHLGAATHLVGDACAPPHASQYVPNHRAYEEWVLPRQGDFAVERGGIYRTDFRVRSGHGGAEWSSAHTRGWLDECAHRAADFVLNTAQPPPDEAGEGGPYARTAVHFRDTQRLTAGYLAFFFETVGGP